VKLRTSFDIVGKRTAVNFLRFPWLVRVSDMKGSWIEIYVLELLMESFTGTAAELMLKLGPILLNLFLFIVTWKLLILACEVYRSIFSDLLCDYDLGSKLLFVARIDDLVGASKFFPIC